MKNDRREFLMKAGIGAGIAGLTAQAAASLRSLLPNVSYDAPTTVKLGPPAEFPDGLKFLPDQRLFVFREGNTFYAISAVCTHLGCTVRAEALSRVETVSIEGEPSAHLPLGVGPQRPIQGKSMRLTHRFLCPCHGSRYSGDGGNVSGPAPRALAWYELSIAPDDGQLVVDLAREVDRDFRLTLA